MNEYLERQLDKKKIFVVRYALIIIFSLIILMTLALAELKIDQHSIISIAFHYYVRNAK